MKLEILGGLSGVDPAEWDALVGDGTPFLEWGWLASLEDSGCVSLETGWQPRHLALRDDAGRIAAACPLYLKSHSAGEFVFDQGWAEAAEGAGIRYYPKLLVASPFTPATGVRFLTRRGDDRPALIRTLGGALREICSQNRLSSVHANFCLPDEVTALAEAGFVERTGYQFQWINPGWETFDGLPRGLPEQTANADPPRDPRTRSAGHHDRGARRGGDSGRGLPLHVPALQVDH